MNVIVLGLGGMGSAACLHLARRGSKVIGLEQFTAAHTFGSSHGETRVIRKAYFEHPDYVPLLLRAYELWTQLERDCGQRLYHETGILYVCPRDSRLLRGIRESAAKFSIPIQEPAPRKFLDRFRVLDGQVTLFEPESGFLEVENCVRAHLRLAEAAGAHLRFNERVLTWSAGESVKVTTDKATYEADRLVITAGAWSAGLLRDLGLPLKVLKKQAYWYPAADTYASAPCFLYEFPGSNFYGFPGIDGGLKLAQHSGGIEITDPKNVDRSLEEREAADAADFVKRALPGVQPRLLRHSTCFYTMTPDENFIIDQHPRHANVFFAAGFSGHGFKFASIVGEAMADLVTLGATRHSIDFLKIRK
jgi:sarcosine oxidase